MDWLITISIVVVFLIFVIFSSVYKKVFNTKKEKWPPHISRCPSYWTLNGDQCFPSEKKINTGNGSSTNPIDSYDSKKDKEKKIKSSLRNSQKYARENQVYWDGISTD